ncbi:MAG TPA: polysaccharide biosynthesis/export family protein [Methylophilaceae bacterium]|jgi:polysaccharide export outer membrane protein
MTKIILLLTLVFSLVGEADEIQYEDYLLDPSDSIHITVYGNEDLTMDATVSANGTIVFPWIGEIRVAGSTTSEVETNIAKKLRANSLIKDAQVHVKIMAFQSKTYSVLGYVKNSGKFPLDKPISLTEAISNAGGQTGEASNIVTIVSTKNGLTSKKEYDLTDFFIKGDKDSNPKILANDQIYVPKYPIFFIYGEVKNPYAYKLERNMSVSQAIATSGGFTLRASKTNFTIERANAAGVTTKIKAKLTDFIQANDVLYIEESLF